jgi:hypothetical protein
VLGGATILTTLVLLDGRSSRMRGGLLIALCVAAAVASSSRVTGEGPVNPLATLRSGVSLVP